VRRQTPSATLPAADRSLPWLADAIPDAMAIVDDRDAIRFVNAAWDALFGYQAAELVGRQVSSLLGVGPPRSGSPHALPANGSAHQAAMVGRKKDGSWQTIDVSPLRHDAAHLHLNGHLGKRGHSESRLIDCRGFSSVCWGVAKLVRRLTLDQVILGSNPSAPAIAFGLGGSKVRKWNLT
jgi:PAS domain S-box-containing protein